MGSPTKRASPEVTGVLDDGAAPAGDAVRGTAMPGGKRHGPNRSGGVERWQTDASFSQRDERGAIWRLVPRFELPREKSATGIVYAQKDQYAAAFAVSKLAPHQTATLVDRDVRLVFHEQQA